MKMAEQPLELKTQLLPYQLQGLYWMQTCEDPQLPVAGSDQIVQFWRAVKSSRGGVVYENTAVMHSQVEQPKFYRGGILADDMGLGKTLQIISMIISDHQRQRMAVSGTGAHIIKPTLIVSPLSVVRNWQEQFEKHVLPDHISVYVYHGPDRVQDVDYLQQFDVVITTFNIVAIEKKTADVNSNSGVSTALPTKGGQKRKRKQQNATGSPLMEIEWRRVVLDEGHLIKSHQSLQTKAVCQLKAERRWIVSGTPIQNKVDDLYALLKFLDFSPFKSSEWWKRIISRPLLAGDPEARAKLRSKFICNQM
jgi:SWI/SNF-related matrix-associated actin-dependent regulator of chromatin subfamily A3